MVEIREYFLHPTDLVPNSPQLLLHYKNVLPRNPDKPGIFSQVDTYDLFEKHGWQVQWLVRYGQTQLSHFHSKAHEVMAVLSGHATIRFGVADTSEDMEENTYGSAYEQGGIELKAVAGDISGVAHKTYDPRPETSFERLTKGDGHSLVGDNPREDLGKIELSGFTMMGAYNGGQWDFVQSGGDYEQIWALSKPELDPVLGDSEEGLRRLWRGNNLAMKVSL
ncbi:hypothetical protein BKA56DRAFT_630755 [Ilyonectria sp. MPI-CAGE-AT-0026]|nr:hypothetical protein BKA56DRAFT_630755 [Ilyonectria sp. MPI-CAGE-AT-0026]